jgi:hypothetical protein
MIKMKENAQQAQELSEQLRLGTGESMAQRRGIVRLSLVAIGSMGLNSMSTFFSRRQALAM